MRHHLRGRSRTSWNHIRLGISGTWESPWRATQARTPPLTNAKSRIDRRRGHGRRQCPVPQGVATSAAVARILLPAPRSTFPPQSKFRRLFDNRSVRSEEHTSELQSLMRISYAVFCLKKKTNNRKKHNQS